MRLTVVQHPERMWKKEVVPEPKSYKISFLNSYGKCIRIIFMYTHSALYPCNIPIFLEACMPRISRKCARPYMMIDIIIVLIIAYRTTYIFRIYKRMVSKANLSLSLSLSLSLYSHFSPYQIIEYTFNLHFLGDSLYSN